MKENIKLMNDFIELNEEELVHIAGDDSIFEKVGKFLHHMFFSDHGVVTITWSANITKIDTSLSAM